MIPAWKKIAWALAILLVDIRINGIDLVWDVIGYVLLVIGVSALTQDTRWQGPFVALTILAGGMSYVMWFIENGQQGINETEQLVPDIGVVCLLIAIFAHLVLVYLLLMLAGGGVLKGQPAVPERRDTIMALQLFYIVVNGGMLIALPFAMNHHGVGPLLAVFTFFAFILEVVVIIYFFHIASGRGIHTEEAAKSTNEDNFHS
ncbi:low temperature requirement protein LtrA [Paenibacillus phyllosphaerae]|uniref:Low temperature requirement protein LtrA n=1 Tax=Paenibacillus phyllosphaerae TaxID=274593 RepID=A0A7W5B1X4_9BACL|nr:hypothetical protein [Paenibacillus phyllosphaerae]MBB3112351.1 low temperature requirement protein LtrA [Paenibacillus phyllosphaerae]